MKRSSIEMVLTERKLNLQFLGISLYWRSRDELIRDVLIWTPTHGRAKAGRPARTYIQQLCEDKGCCPEDLPRAMDDKEEWRERTRDIYPCCQHDMMMIMMMSRSVTPLGMVWSMEKHKDHIFF